MSTPDLRIMTTRSRLKVLSAICATQTDNQIEVGERKLRNLTKAINEIISSEQNYLHQLDVLKEFFLEPIVHKQLVPIQDIRPIFSELETILQVNSTLLVRLLEDKNCGSVGQAFIELAPFLKLYSAYANKYEPACAAVQKFEKERKEFAAFMTSQETRPEVNAKFESLLITPVQRVPRYQLLLEKVLENSSDDTNDYLLIEAALTEIRVVAMHIKM